MGEPVVRPGRSSQLWDQQAMGIGQATNASPVTAVHHHSPSIVHPPTSFASVAHLCHSQVGEVGCSSESEVQRCGSDTIKLERGGTSGAGEAYYPTLPPHHPQAMDDVSPPSGSGAFYGGPQPYRPPDGYYNLLGGLSAASPAQYATPGSGAALPVVSPTPSKVEPPTYVEASHTPLTFAEAAAPMDFSSNPPSLNFSGAPSAPYGAGSDFSNAQGYPQTATNPLSLLSDVALGGDA
ncbi:hypothetical protein OTU49_012264, partial [Cherax quadricarinatus]